LFYTLHGHEGATLAAAFSPAGDYFSSAGADEQVMVWKTNFDSFLEDTVVPIAQKQQFSSSAAPTKLSSIPAQSPSPAPASIANASAAPKEPAPAIQEYVYEAPPALNLSDLPDSLSATLQHIVGQLDVLTQTVALLDERLTMNEDRVRAMDKGETTNKVWDIQQSPDQQQI
jgi:centriolar protein POC1